MRPHFCNRWIKLHDGIWGDYYSDEEWDVKHALKDYQFDRTRFDQWCTVADLYDVYLRYYHTTSPYPGDRETVKLSRQAFGAAVRRVFPLAVYEEDETGAVLVADWNAGIRPTKRRINGKRVCGFAGLVGPASRGLGKPGRPPKRRSCSACSGSH